MKILFIQTGGTIDKDYPKQISGYAFEIGEPAVKRVLERINPPFDYEILTLIQKDSTELTDDDRQKIYEVCANSKEDNIIITHGTDTMLETAKFISPIKNKTIILTGSFKPEMFTHSDAEFNLGTAVGAINFAEAGVYIAMKGRVFCHDRIRRDLLTGKFLAK
ncbi:MAG: asparaginase domain-containing protein [Ignavibacteriae bacterium]|jgi:L-asparaginase|nr:asparaginase domain-containing protein [Ignavibacteriota bacterium]